MLLSIGGVLCNSPVLPHQTLHLPAPLGHQGRGRRSEDTQTVAGEHRELCSHVASDSGGDALGPGVPKLEQGSGEEGDRTGGTLQVWARVKY